MGDEQLQDPARPSAEGDHPDVGAGQLSDPDLESVTGGYFSADPDLQPGY